MSKFKRGDKVVFKGNFKNTSTLTQQLDEDSPMTILSVYSTVFYGSSAYLVKSKDTEFILEEEMLELHSESKGPAGEEAIFTLNQIAEYLMDYKDSEYYTEKQLIKLIDDQILEYFKEYPNSSNDRPITLKEAILNLTQEDYIIGSHSSIDFRYINSDIVLKLIDEYTKEES